MMAILLELTRSELFDANELALLEEALYAEIAGERRNSTLIRAAIQKLRRHQEEISE